MWFLPEWTLALPLCTVRYHNGRLSCNCAFKGSVNRNSKNSFLLYPLPTKKHQSFLQCAYSKSCYSYILLASFLCFFFLQFVHWLAQVLLLCRSCCTLPKECDFFYLYIMLVLCFLHFFFVCNKFSCTVTSCTVQIDPDKHAFKVVRHVFTCGSWVVLSLLSQVDCNKTDIWPTCFVFTLKEKADSQAPKGGRDS